MLYAFESTMHGLRKCRRLNVKVSKFYLGYMTMSFYEKNNVIVNRVSSSKLSYRPQANPIASAYENGKRLFKAPAYIM